MNAPSQNRAATSPKPVDAYRPSSSLKKPVIRSSPSSPSRAKGTHTYAQTSPFLGILSLLETQGIISISLCISLSPFFPRLSCTVLTTVPENQRRFVVCLSGVVICFLDWYWLSVVLVVNNLLFHLLFSTNSSSSPQLFHPFARYYCLTYFPPSSLSPRCSLLDI